jgi:alkanesulfonate monooxygenase SsuD/methylene tetrahydromethanopterin reductase-like flavin-dependent oxidoreductase (luciferase family)
MSPLAAGPRAAQSSMSELPRVQSPSWPRTEVLDRFTFSGTPEHVAELARNVLDAGAGRVDFGTPHGLSDNVGVRLLGSRVLPLLRP